MPDFQNETPPEFAPAPGEPSLRPPPEPTYTDDQAKAILERAVRIAAENPITREDLVRAAAELDISAEVVDRAEKNLYTNSSNEALRQIYRLKQTARYQKRLVTAVEVTVIFMVIWFFSGRGYFWPGWIIPWVYLELFTTFPTAILKNSAIYKEREDRFVAKAIGAKKAGRSEN